MSPGLDRRFYVGVLGAHLTGLYRGARELRARYHSSLMSALPRASSDSLLASGRRALAIEAKAVAGLSPRLGPAFVSACEALLACQGRAVVTGMGKSGHVGSKLAATLASTGTPAFFLHAAEASHGDIGMITRQDTVIAVSNSGETPELLTILPPLVRLGVPLIAMTGSPESTLAKAANAHLDCSVAEEACPLNLAPTASTTAALAMGDALAVALLEARGFTAADFARSHPGGSIGRRMLLHVADVMRTGDAMPIVAPDALLAKGLIEMSRKGLGMTVVCDAANKIVGVFTDGDLRRALDARLDLHAARMSDVMTTHCRTIKPNDLAAEAVHIMETHRITALPVCDASGVLIGALNVHDLLRAGAM
jgi:arabinose-5-phosphate isomerase